jgi:hypothetical protein
LIFHNPLADFSGNKDGLQEKVKTGNKRDLPMEITRLVIWGN